MDAWVTDQDLAAAADRFAANNPGYVQPVAYSVARYDDEHLTFGHINRLGEVRRLPAVVLAKVCGHASGTATYQLRRGQLDEAVGLLAPAEAATHMPHPNLWSWRKLMDDASEASTFMAFFLADVSDPVLDDWDGAFRLHLV